MNPPAAKELHESPNIVSCEYGSGYYAHTDDKVRVLRECFVVHTHKFRNDVDRCWMNSEPHYRMKFFLLVRTSRMNADHSSHLLLRRPCTSMYDGRTMNMERKTKTKTANKKYYPTRGQKTKVGYQADPRFVLLRPRFSASIAL